VVERYTDAGRAVGSALVMSRQSQWLDASLSPDARHRRPGTVDRAERADLRVERAWPPHRTSDHPSQRTGRRRLRDQPDRPPARHRAQTAPPFTGVGGAPATWPRPLMIDLRTGRWRTLAAPTTPSPWQVFAFSRTRAAVAAGSALRAGGCLGHRHRPQTRAPNPNPRQPELARVQPRRSQPRDRQHERHRLRRPWDAHGYDPPTTRQPAKRPRVAYGPSVVISRPSAWTAPPASTTPAASPNCG
jgi:hypothetical protein